MSDNRNSTSTITIRLNMTNYNQWKTMAEVFLDQKVLRHHTKYSSYEEYRRAEYEPSSTKEKKYFKAKDLILAKPFTPEIITIAAVNGVGGVIGVPAYDEDAQETDLEQLEDNTKDYKSFEGDRAKAKQLWSDQENQLYGILSGCIEEGIWQEARSLKPCFEIWSQLKRLTGQHTASSWMTCLSQFFTIAMNDNDSLTAFVSKITKLNNNIIDIGDAKIKFTDLHIIAKIVSAIPQTNPRYQTLLQSIHQIDKNVLTLDLLKDIFITEDKRVENVKNLNRREAANQLKIQERNQEKKAVSKPNNGISIWVISYYRSTRFID